jgi:uncharacterized phage protein (TIGR01671 family)
MREIKFRAWEKNLKEIIPVHNIDFEKKMINTDSAWRLFEEIELMQYTGLHDKNGKEIYEGDIVEDWDDGPGYWEVKWNSEYGCFYIFESHIWEKFYLDDMIAVIEEGKVIGNIFENPELLEE